MNIIEDHEFDACRDHLIAGLGKVVEDFSPIQMPIDAALTAKIYELAMELLIYRFEMFPMRSC